MSYESRGYRARQDGNRYNRPPGGRYRDDRRNSNRRNHRGASPPRDDDLEDIEQRLKGLIIKIGDKISPELQVNLNKMKNILDNDYSKYPDTVQDTIKGCISDLPAKAPVYATLLGLLNVSSHDIVEKLLLTVNDMLQDCLATSNFFKLKQILRFYGELVNANVILPTTYCTMLNDILAPLDESDQLRRRLDCFVYIVLSVLPWSAKELHDRSSADLDQILNKIGVYMTKRGNVPTLDILKQYHSGDYEVNEEPLQHLWNLINDLRAKGWAIALIPKPHQWFDKEFSSALQHQVPRLTIAKHTDATRYIKPHKILKIHVDDAGQSLPIIPQHNSIEYFILHDIIVDTIQIFEPNRKECSKYLLGLAQNFEPGHFATPNPPTEDNEDAMDEDTTKWRLADLLLEVIFAQMLNLPTTQFRQVFYSCALTELCRADGAAFPLALGRCLKTLFERLEDMDVECVYRLYTWFAHHLSNFGFQWDWKSWEVVLTLDPSHPKTCFVRETLDKTVRLSYYEHIKSIVPPEFTVFLSSVPPGPDYAYSQPDHPLHQRGKEVIDSLRAKKPVEDIRAILDRFREELASQGRDEEIQFKMVRELFLQSLLSVGSKSFSHVLNVVERYLEILRYVNSNSDARLHTVQIVADFWKNNTQFLGILLDKLLNYRVIDPTSVTAWAFESQQLNHAARSFIWEILKNTLNKVVARVTQVKQKLETYRELHLVNEEKRAQEPDSEMAQAESQQEQDTLRIVENSLATVTREQKEVFMVVYQKFVQVLQDMLAPVPRQEKDAQLTWTFYWVSGWFKEVLRMYHNDCSGFFSTLETVIFNDQIDDRFTKIFEDVKKLNATVTATV